MEVEMDGTIIIIKMMNWQKNCEHHWKYEN